jgi:prephenate dehydrogenase
LPGKPGLLPEALVELAIPVPDRPGVLAELTTTMGEAGINIEDLDIFHSPEGGRGTIYLTVNGEEAAGRAVGALRRKGFQAERISY